jgi:pimeloyl-ACP methyl ester carboxylesterase
MDCVEVGGLRITYQRAGRGPALVLLHGAYSDSRLWRQQLDGLSDEFTVVAWDAPGCGRSADPPPGFGADDLGECLAGFLDAAGLDRPHVLGLSWGAGFALDLYRRRPGVPASLLLASAYAGWAGSLPPDEVRRRVAQVRAELDLTPERFVPQWIPTLLTERATPEIVAEVAALMSQFRRAGMRMMLGAAAHADYRDVLPTIAVPTLLLYGAEDRRSTPTVGRDIHERIPGSTLVVLPGTGHLGNLETPEDFNREVRRFLGTPGLGSGTPESRPRSVVELA